MTVLQPLHTNGADIHKVSSNGNSYKMLTLEGTGDCETVTCFIEQGADVSYCSKSSYTVLFFR